MNYKKVLERKKAPGYSIIKCPICEVEAFEYISYCEYGWGIVEQYGNCERCGYVLKQAYSRIYDAFYDIKRGFKHPKYGYQPKNVKRHRRIRRKLNIKDIEINPMWIYK